MQPQGARYLLLASLAVTPMLATDVRVIARPARADVGRITGTVQTSNAFAARRPRFRIYADPGPGSVPPAQENDVAREMRNVVVYLEFDRASALGATPLAADSLRRDVMAQSDERFEPHVLSVLQSATVEFPTRDDVYHNVFSLS